MRELKGDWKDLFNGFMLALDLRKMFLGFCGILFTIVGPIGAMCWTAYQISPDHFPHLETYGLHDLWTVVSYSFHVIFHESTSVWQWLPIMLAVTVATLAVWAYFGGAISRIAAYEIAKDGERIETARALQFARRKFWAFFMSPWVCIIGFGFFFFCCWVFGVVGRVLDFVWIGGPLVALLLPLALLAGFVMTLIGLGTVAGFPLFAPAVAAEGTDAFDAMSRGFSYVYSRPWHYILYQAIALLYGVVCVGFVMLFAVTLCHAGLTAGGAGFDMFGVRPPKPELKRPADLPRNATPEEKKKWESQMKDFYTLLHASGEEREPQNDRFRDIADAAWALVLTNRYENDHFNLVGRKGDEHDVNFVGVRPKPCKYVYGRLMNTTNSIVRPDHSMTINSLKTPSHRVAAYIVVVWLFIALGLALGYIPSYLLSQQTLIYALLRKRVDGIEMNEVFEEAEEEIVAVEEAPKSADPSKPPPPPPPTA